MKHKSRLCQNPDGGPTLYLAPGAPGKCCLSFCTTSKIGYSFLHKTCRPLLLF